MNESEHIHRCQVSGLSAELDQCHSRVRELEVLVAEALPLVSKTLRLDESGPSRARVAQLLEGWHDRATNAVGK